MIRGNNHANDFCCISDRVRTYIGLLILELSINCLLITLVPSCSVCQFSEIFSNASLSFALSHTVSKRWSFVLFAKKNSSSFALSCTVSQPFSFLLFAQNSSPLTTYPHLCLLFFFSRSNGLFSVPIPGTPGDLHCSDPCSQPCFSYFWRYFDSKGGEERLWPMQNVTMSRMSKPTSHTKKPRVV